ncbi:leucine--tRNA ligase [Malassezia cuniculi]|uniref:leucine--tRNA ligase n=1 Tax=Malassezia cuniculi TaxID=948313 RepID=A0AAF0EX05_9BASI|nr:leucine--tRNA ligase [Malassezia cuniculi]
MSAKTAQNAGPIKLENVCTAKRDFLRSLESRYQKEWAENHVFEVDMPNEAGLETLSPDELRAKYPKFFATIPYAYMNGSLHLGHAFTLSKAEFAIGYERMLGKRALFPWGFHCTGMPIRAAADKLIRELELFGDDFSGVEAYEAKQAAEAEAAAAASAGAADNAPQRADKATKGKLAGKATGLKYQFQIMLNSGVPLEEIKNFADPLYWLKYFPPIAKEDCNAFGLRIDWRRSFITTDANPYYDSFVRWQMNKLHQMDRIKFGERYTVYSPKDGQPAMDHDRSEGEGLGPQEYTGLKMRVVQWSKDAAPLLDAKLAGKNVYFVAATLRPETMYGQTNCFVGPRLDYGAFAINDTDVFICTERAARNFAYQGIVSERGRVESLATVPGSALVGTLVHAPFSVHNEVYVLPMDTVLATKGTGVVTSVPSDSPDDYAMFTDLRKKAEFYGVDPAWLAHEITPVISTPEYGNLIAETLVQKLKIQSPKDKNALAEAKDIAYKQGFYNGTMLVGTHAGLPVAEAKPLVQKELIDAGLAFVYAEPEGRIISRSGDECVVALVDQWYLDYGEPKWKEQTELLLSRMNTYQPETRNSFEGVLGWLHQWACARTYGLGSRLPWDPQYLVESLSDSTIYMAYYTVAYRLQGGTIDGSSVGPAGIRAEDLTDELWDFILGSGEFPAESKVPRDVAEGLRREFRYFYPMDLRSSGKDLIANHLTFCLYNHAAMFPEELWPLSMRANGHLMLNGLKMSKSTGNSLSLRQAVDKFGADATRVSLADAGDGIEDANFEEKTANANILRLHTLIEWCEDMMRQINEGKLRTGEPDSFWDRTFLNNMNAAVLATKDAYERAAYKEASKLGFYEFLSARDLYREATADVGMHADLVRHWIATQALLIAPIAPHFSEHVWRAVLGNETTVHDARFPEPTKPVDSALTAAFAYVRGTVKTIRDAEIAVTRRKGKAAAALPRYDERQPKEVSIFVADAFPAWQDTCVAAIQKNYDAATSKVDDVKVREELAAAGLLKDKKAMPFVMAFKNRIASFGAELAFNRQLPFNETETLNAASGYLKKTLGFRTVHVQSASEALARADELQGKLGFDRTQVEGAEPGALTGRLLAVLAFLALGASFILQLLVSIGLPYIRSFYFLRLIYNNSQEFTFGIWSQCGPWSATMGNTIECTPSGLGYNNFSLSPQTDTGSPIADPINHGLAHALVLQPIATGLIGLAALTAFLSVFSRSLFWVLITIVALIVTYVALAVELAFFILARDDLKNTLNAVGGNSTVNFGPALWMQVAAAAVATVGCLAAIAAYAAPSADKTPPGYAENLRASYVPHSYEHDQYVPEENYKYSYDNPYVTDNVHQGYGDENPIQPSYVSTMPAGRAANSPDERLLPLVEYDPRTAGSKPPAFERKRSRRHSRRHSRHRSHRDSKHYSHGHSRRRSRHHSRHLSRSDSKHYSRHGRTETYPPRQPHEYNYDYDSRVRRRSFEYGKSKPSRTSRLYPSEMRFAPDENRNSQNWTRYSERGAF